MPDDSAAAYAAFDQLTRTDGGGYLATGPGAAGALEFRFAVGRLELDGTVDPVTKDASYDLHVVLPIVGKTTVASAQGDLTDGTMSTVDTPIAIGTTSLHLKNDDEIWFSYDITSLGEPLKGGVKLFSMFNV